MKKTQQNLFRRPVLIQLIRLLTQLIRLLTWIFVVKYETPKLQHCFLKKVLSNMQPSSFNLNHLH